MLKKSIALLALMAIAPGAALASSALCVNVPGVVALTDSRGSELLENGRFEDIFPVREDALYAAGSGGDYRLYDALGQPLGDITFSMIDDAGDALVYRVGTRYGALDPAGGELLPARWTQLTPDGAGGWLALEDDPFDEQPDELIHIDASGTAAATGVRVAGGLSPVVDGRMPFVDEDGRFGAVNALGAVAIGATWLYLGPFSDGLAKARGPEGLGLVDAGGRPVVPPVYAWLERSRAMVAAMRDGGLDVFGPHGGQRRFTLPGPIVEAAMVGEALAVNYGDRTCLYDAAGGQLARFDAGTVLAPGCGGQFVASGGAWGEACQWLVDPDGSPASGRFQQILPLGASRYAFLVMEGIEYYSAELGRVQSSWDYAGGCYGLLDDRGRVLLPAQYREIRALGDDRLLLVGEEEVLLTDRDGATIRVWATGSAAPTAEAGE